MAGETTITVIGNLTGDPELRFTPSGAAVANFTVASTPRNFDRQSNEWKDGETLFMRCSVWREIAENVAESLHRGTRVIVSGRLKSRSYETKEGEKRTVIEMDVDEVGPSLRYATTKITRTTNSGGNSRSNTNSGGSDESSGGWPQDGGGWGNGNQNPTGGATQGGVSGGGWGNQNSGSTGGGTDSWSQQPAPATSGGGWGTQGGSAPYDEPPF